MSCASSLTNIPPSPVVMFLIGWNENIAVPEAPIFSALYWVPRACAASSSRKIPWRSASALKPSRSNGAPAKWTGTIILVRGVMAASAASGEIIRVSRSQSTKTGVAPKSSAVFGSETHVIDGVITSSPGPIPRARNSANITDVSDVIATADAAPVYALNFSSNSVFFGPVVIQSV